MKAYKVKLSYTILPDYFITGIFSAIPNNTSTFFAMRGVASGIDTKGNLIAHIPSWANMMLLEWLHFLGCLVPIGSASNLLVSSAM